MPGGAAVAMWWDIPPEARAEWEHWHTTEHMHERLAIPGCRPPAPIAKEETPPVLSAEGSVLRRVGPLRVLTELVLAQPDFQDERIALACWALALSTLGREELTESAVSATLGTVVKYREDQERLRREGLGVLVAEAVGRGA